MRGSLIFGFLFLNFLGQAYSLLCLRCISTDVNSRCRFGSRNKNSNNRQICRGSKAECFVVATVNEYGSAYFQRGCTEEDVCKDRNDTDIEFCRTCKSKYCNYDVIELDEEVEDYLNKVRNNNNNHVDVTKKEIINNTQNSHNGFKVARSVRDSDPINNIGDITFGDEDEILMDSIENEFDNNFVMDVRISRTKK